MLKWFNLYLACFLIFSNMAAAQGLPANPWGNAISVQDNSTLNNNTQKKLNIEPEIKQENKEVLSANPWINHSEILDKEDNENNKTGYFTKISQALKIKNNRWDKVRNPQNAIVWRPRVHRVQSSAGKTATTLTSLKFRSDGQQHTAKTESSSSSDFDSFLNNLKSAGYNIPSTETSSPATSATTPSTDYSKLFKSTGTNSLNSIKNTATGSVNSAIRQLEKQSGFNLHKIFNH